jgi:hypothetical protein
VTQRARRRPKPDPAPLPGKTAERGELPISELLGMGAPYNPRVISPHDLESLRRSIRFFGFVEPVVVNRRTSHIVGGHQRVQAAAEEGYTVLPVAFVDLDDPSERQLNLALNRISGEWDDSKLRELLAGLSTDGADLALTGFADDELGRILAAGSVSDDAPDQFNEPDEKTEHVCPRCGYRWNGDASLGASTVATDEEDDDA